MSSFRSGRTSAVRALLALVWLCAWSAPAAAESLVRIDVSKSPGRLIRVLLPPFFKSPAPDEEAGKLRTILDGDLKLAGFFDVLQDLPPDVETDGQKLLGKAEGYDRLIGRGVELLINVYDRSEGGKLVLEGYVFDPATRQQIFGKRYRGPLTSPAKIIHLMAGEIIQELTGVKPLTLSRLAFLWNVSGKKQVFVADYDGRDPRAVSPAGELALFPEWQRDGRSLAYTSYVSGFPELIYLDVDSGFQKILASYPGMNANPSFSPDGRNLLVTLSKDGNPEIYKMDLRGSVIQRMTYDAGVDTSPCYSPDGREFVFVSDRGGGPQIYVMNAVSGGKPRRITFRGGYNTSPDWSPSGKHIAYSSLVEGRYQLMLINPATGEVAQLTDGPGNKEDPDWGVDDRHLVFTLTKDHKSDLYIIDIFSKETTRITKGKGDFTSPSWSSGGP